MTDIDIMETTVRVNGKTRKARLITTYVTREFEEIDEYLIKCLFIRDKLSVNEVAQILGRRVEPVFDFCEKLIGMKPTSTMGEPIDWHRDRIPDNRVKRYEIEYEDDDIISFHSIKKMLKLPVDEIIRLLETKEIKGGRIITRKDCHGAEHHEWCAPYGEIMKYLRRTNGN